MTDQTYPRLSVFKTGPSCLCPRCGKGSLFAGFLTVARRCTNCGLDYSFADAGDGATWFVMLFASVFGVGSILGIEVAYAPPWWVHVLIAIPVLIIVPTLLLRPVKGLLINQQWLTDASEGRLQK